MGEPILPKVWIIWSPLLYLYFKSFMHPNSSSLIRFQCILHNSGEIFSESQNLYKLKTGGPNLWGEPILENVWIIWSPLLYFNFKSFMESNSLSFISFQCILHDAGVLFPECWNFYKLQRADLISGRSQFCAKPKLFGHPFCIWIWIILLTKILRH